MTIVFKEGREEKDRNKKKNSAPADRTSAPRRRQTFWKNATAEKKVLKFTAKDACWQKRKEINFSLREKNVLSFLDNFAPIVFDCDRKTNWPIISPSAAGFVVLFPDKERQKKF